MGWGDTVIEVDDGIRLRAWCERDLTALVKHAGDARVSGGLGERFPHPYRYADGIAFLCGRVVDFSNPVFAIDIEGKACGGIDARPFPGERAVGAEFGYWLGHAYWGKGIMSRVVSVFVPWVMDALAVQRLQATVLDFNTGSVRVLERNGFVEEGVMRRAVCKQGQLHDLRMFARLRDG